MEMHQTKLQLSLAHYNLNLANGSADAYSHLAMGLMWHWEEGYREALECFDRAVNSEPFVPYALCARANLLATCPIGELRDGRQSVIDAQRAHEGAALAGELKEEWRLRTYSAVLAAAHCECGNYAKAAEDLRRIIAQVQTHTSRSELATYLGAAEHGKPIHLKRGLLRQGERRPGAA